MGFSNSGKTVGKTLALSTILLGGAVLSASVWTLCLPGLSHFPWSPWPVSQDSIINIVQPENVSENLKTLVTSCVGAGGLASTLQILLSILVICASEKNLKCRLETWEALSLVCLLVHTTCALIPLTFDLETDSFLGIHTFGSYLLNGGNYPEDSIWTSLTIPTEQSKTMTNLIWTIFPAYAVALCLNIIASTSFLIINASWLCCCSTRVKHSEGKKTRTGHKSRRSVTQVSEDNEEDSGAVLNEGDTDFSYGMAQLRGPDLIFN